MSNNNSGKVEELKEKLAAIEHERWADWQKWCHEVLRRELPLDFSPRLDKVLERWDKQIETPYSELSEKEKASDMEQVDRYWHSIEAYISSKVNEEVIKELESLKDNSVLYPVDPEWERAVPEKMFEDRIRTLTENPTSSNGK